MEISALQISGDDYIAIAIVLLMVLAAAGVLVFNAAKSEELPDYYESDPYI